MVAYRPANIRFSYTEYALMPNDGRRRELIDGDFFVNPAPSSRHQLLSARLHHVLMSQLYDSGVAQVVAAPIDVILSDHDVVQPDLAIVRASRFDKIVERGIEGPPDVVVEILSKDATYDRVVKRALYARFGVPEYWIVDPAVSSVELLRLEAGGYVVHGRFDRSSTLTSVEFPEVGIPLVKVFK